MKKPNISKETEDIITAIAVIIIVVFIAFCIIKFFGVSPRLVNPFPQNH